MKSGFLKEILHIFKRSIYSELNCKTLLQIVIFRCEQPLHITVSIVRPSRLSGITVCSGKKGIPFQATLLHPGDLQEWVPEAAALQREKIQRHCQGKKRRSSLFITRAQMGIYERKKSKVLKLPILSWPIAWFLPFFLGTCFFLGRNCNLLFFLGRQLVFFESYCFLFKSVFLFLNFPFLFKSSFSNSHPCARNF